jgi:hypothetical protein
MLIDPIEKVDGQRNRQRMGVDVPDSSPSEALQSSTLNPLHDHLLLPLTVAHHLLYFYRLSTLSNSGSGPAILSKTYIHSLDTSVSVVQPPSFSAFPQVEAHRQHVPPQHRFCTTVLVPPLYHPPLPSTPRAHPASISM